MSTDPEPTATGIAVMAEALLAGAVTARQALDAIMLDAKPGVAVRTVARLAIHLRPGSDLSNEVLHAATQAGN